jgi:phosphomannomutase
MRSLMEQFSKFQHEVVDGIKIYLDEGEWVLIRPDEDAAVFHLVAEGHSKQAAQELIADYGGFVQSLIRESSTPAGVAAQHEAGIRPGGQAGT